MVKATFNDASYGQIVTEELQRQPESISETTGRPGDPHSGYTGKPITSQHRTNRRRIQEIFMYFSKFFNLCHSQ